MGFVDIQPDTDIGGYPLISTIVGAASRFSALADSNDATYVKQESASAVDGVDIIGFQNPSIPAGAVVTGAEVHGRVAHVPGTAIYSFGAYANPKPAYVSPYGPDPFAGCTTPQGADIGSWYYVTTPDGNPQDFVITYNPTFQYNNGFYAWDQLTWNQVDLNSLRVLYGYFTPSAAVNRIFKLFLRIFYDSVPTVSGVQPADLSAGQTFTTTPTITWTYADTEGNVQTQYRVIVVQNTISDGAGIPAGTAGFNPETATTKAYDSGIVPGATNRSTVTPIGLNNLSSYYAYVKVYHAPNQGNEMASAWTASAVFQVNGTPPNAATITATADDTNSRIILEVLQGNWNATPYPNYFDVTKILDTVAGTQEYVRGGINVSRMTAIRTGSDANNDITSPHSASLNVTGDLDIRACIALEGTPPANGHYIFSKADGLGTMYQFRILSDFKLEFQWWNGASLQIATSPNPVPVPTAKTPFWIRVKHVVASNWHADFYYSLDASSTTPSQVNWLNTPGNFTGTGSGTKTAINAQVEINRASGAIASAFRVYYLEVRNSSDVIVANPDFRGFTVGATTNTDSTGKVWTINRTNTNQTRALVILYDYDQNQGDARFYNVKAITLSSGSPVAAAAGAGFTAGLAINTPYLWWFKVLVNPVLNRSFQLLPGTWDAHRPAESAAFTPLGRTYKVVVSDGAKGHEQKLQVECLSVTDYNALKAIYEAQQVVLVQTYQNQRYLALMDWTDDRGTLANGYSVVTLDTIEVDRPAIT